MVKKFVKRPGDICSKCKKEGHWANTCAVKKGKKSYYKKNYYNN